jgi:hypothetical protein
MINPTDLDKDLNDVLFCETILNALDELDTMPAEEQSDLLQRLETSTPNKGRSVARAVIQIAIKNPNAKELLKAEIRSGRIYQK